MLKESPHSQEIDNSLRKKQLSPYKQDKRLREREVIEPNWGSGKRTRLEILIHKALVMRIRSVWGVKRFTIFSNVKIVGEIWREQRYASLY